MSRVATIINPLMHPGSRLSQRVVYAGFWSFITRFSVRVLTTLSTVVLARLLTPSDFGVMGIALLMMTLLETFTQTGVRTALVQRQGDIRPYLDTAWTIQLLRGLLLAGVLASAAPFIANFFNAPSAINVVRVMGIALLINGFSNIAIVYFEKELEFQKRFLNQLAQTVPQVAVGIGLAFALQNVWALVYGILAGYATRVMVSYLLHPYRPRPRLEWAKALEMYRFGRWILLDHMVSFLSNRGDGLLAGKLLGPVSLGLYQMGQRFAELATRELLTVGNSVAFPAFSQLQNNKPLLGKAFLMSLATVASIVLPVSIAMFFLAGPLVSVILGEQWAMVAAVLPALTAAGAIRALSSTGGAMFMGVGRPDLDFKQNLLRLVVVFSLVYPLVQVSGLAGAGYAVLAGAVIILPFLFWFARKLLDISIWRSLAAMLPAILLSVTVGVVLAVASRVIHTVGISDLAIMLALAAGGYALVSVLLWKMAAVGPMAVLKMLRSR